LPSFVHHAYAVNLRRAWLVVGWVIRSGFSSQWGTFILETIRTFKMFITCYETIPFTDCLPREEIFANITSAVTCECSSLMPDWRSISVYSIWWS